MKSDNVLTFDRLFPFYLIVTFFGLFVMFAGLRCMIDGSGEGGGKGEATS